MINLRNIREILSMDYDKVKAHIILVMVDLGKANGHIICKMVQECIRKQMDRFRKAYGKWDKE